MYGKMKEIQRVVSKNTLLIGQLHAPAEKEKDNLDKNYSSA